MPDATLTFQLADGVKHSVRRAVGFLHGHSQLTAKGSFTSGLNAKSQRAVKTYMDAWVDGASGPQNRFHGFPNDKDYKDCFVFKVKQGNQGHRLYGYLCHPCLKTNSSFQLCVLCVHATKNQHETDRSELARVKQWFESESAKNAIRKMYPDIVNPSKAKVLAWNR